MLRSTKRGSIQGVGLVAAFIGLSGGSALAARRVVDRVAAVIENEVITVRELEDQAGDLSAELDAIDDSAEREARRMVILRQVLDREISDRVIDREIAESGEKIGITDADVDRAVEGTIRENNMSRDEFQDELYRQGLSWAEFREDLRKQLQRTRLFGLEVRNKVEIGDAEVKRRCLERKRAGRVNSEQRVCASHILLALPEEASVEEVEAVRERAQQLRSELVAGADFEDYAERFSVDRSSPDGNLGCFGRGEMLDAFEDAAFGLEPGSVSEPVRTEFGLHLIRVRSREVADSGCSSEDELLPIKNRMFEEEFERQLNAWVQTLRERSFIDIRL